MKKLLIMSAVSAMALGACTSNAPVKTSGIDYTNLDTTARPGDDFFKFATGNWINNNPQPAAFPRWGSFTKLADDNTNQLSELIQGLAAEEHEFGSVAQKVGDLYKLCMDSTRLNAEGYTPLLPYLEKINSMKTREDLIAYAASEHDNLLWSLYCGADEKDSKNNIVQIGQGGLSLGNRDYYISDDPQVKKIREAFIEHAQNLYKLVGTDEATAAKKVATIMKYETQIAQASKSMEELRDPEANYNKMTVAELSKLCSFDWALYLKNYTYDQTDTIVIGQPIPVALACKIINEAPLDDLKTIYEFQTISGLSGLLSDDFTNENFAFNQKLTGAKEQQPRWKRAVNRVDGLLGEAVGQMYVKKYFPAESKERMVKLVANLQTSLGEVIKAQEWMSEETKKVALEKLSTFYVKVGYPDEWEDISGLTIDPQKSLLENVVAASKFYWNLSKEKHYNKPVDKNEWFMTPQTVNAYYNPTTNEICFPAGILQPPFFSKDFDDAVNYGAIGVVIGHEMTHGFDDQGRQYDKDGNLRQWWNEEDVKAFNVPAEQMVQYYDSLWVIPGDLYSNGRLCLGENLADHGGLNIAFKALKIAEEQNGKLPVENGFTPEQRFFLSYANVWAGVSTDELLRRYTLIDVHSASHLRVNGGVAQCNAWYEAFNIQPGDALYVAPENRVNIW